MTVILTCIAATSVCTYEVQSLYMMLWSWAGVLDTTHVSHQLLLLVSNE